MNNKVVRTETIEITDSRITRTQTIEIEGHHFDQMMRPIRNSQV
jgi:hypothetical protein